MHILFNATINAVFLQARLLKQTLHARQAQQLLGETSARHWPQTGARAAAKNDGSDVDHASCTL